MLALHISQSSTQVSKSRSTHFTHSVTKNHADFTEPSTSWILQKKRTLYVKKKTIEWQMQQLPAGYWRRCKTIDGRGQKNTTSRSQYICPRVTKQLRSNVKIT